MKIGGRRRMEGERGKSADGSQTEVGEASGVRARASQAFNKPARSWAFLRIASYNLPRSQSEGLRFARLRCREGNPILTSCGTYSSSDGFGRILQRSGRILQRFGRRQRRPVGPPRRGVPPPPTAPHRARGPRRPPDPGPGPHGPAHCRLGLALARPSPSVRVRRLRPPDPAGPSRPESQSVCPSLSFRVRLLSPPVRVHPSESVYPSPSVQVRRLRPPEPAGPPVSRCPGPSPSPPMPARSIRPAAQSATDGKREPGARIATDSDVDGGQARTALLPSRHRIAGRSHEEAESSRLVWAEIGPPLGGDRPPRTFAAQAGTTCQCA
jgi:hypothetical protein